VRGLERDDANPPAAFGHIELGALPRLVAKPEKGRGGGLRQARPALAGETPEFYEAGAEAVTTTVLFDQPVSDEGRKQSVSRGSRHARARGHLEQGGGAGGRQVLQDGDPLAQRPGTG
jgi:hypothetical protein